MAAGLHGLPDREGSPPPAGLPLSESMISETGGLSTVYASGVTRGRAAKQEP